MTAPPATPDDDASSASTGSAAGDRRADARRRLARAMGHPTGDLARHPDDGWIFADPVPMSPRLVDKLHGLIRAMCPQTPDVPDLELRISHQLRRMMRYMQPFVRIGFKSALHIIDAAAIAAHPARKPLRRLPRAEAAAVIGRLADGPVKPLSDLVAATRAAIMAPFYDLDEVQAHVGYQPAPFMRGRVALRKRLLAGGRAGPGDGIGPFSAPVERLERDAQHSEEGAA